tara:strand:- start:827 stop:964 length:138 start_codon:yes stop_codon:yes gene_type:complete
MVINNQIFNYYRENKKSIDKELDIEDAKTLLKNDNFVVYKNKPKK